MTAADTSPGRATATFRDPLPHLIRADQLAAVRSSVLLAIPVNALLGVTAACVA